VLDGDSFETPTNEVYASGGVPGTYPTASGVYSFVVPINPPGPGVYPVKIHMSPVGSTNRLTKDLQLTENAW
jgi:hypothetical protein